jgi:hypothetical protein
MSLDQWMSRLENTTIGTAVRGDSGWEWLFPNIETLHVLSFAAVFGSILMVDLRLLGISSRGSAVSRLSAEVLPYTWVAFGCAAVTGGLMFASKAQTYVHNLQFQLKFACMVLAGINMAIFHLGAYQHVLDWDRALPPPRAARLAGGLSVLLWVCVIFTGRWVGFTTS